MTMCRRREHVHVLISIGFSKQALAWQGKNSAVMTMLQEQMRPTREAYCSIQATHMAEMRVMVESRQAKSSAKFDSPLKTGC